jgi:hypothetical protein
MDKLRVFLHILRTNLGFERKERLGDDPLVFGFELIKETQDGPDDVVQILVQVRTLVPLVDQSLEVTQDPRCFEFIDFVVLRK